MKPGQEHYTIIKPQKGKTYNINKENNITKKNEHTSKF